MRGVQEQWRVRERTREARRKRWWRGERAASTWSRESRVPQQITTDTAATRAAAVGAEERDGEADGEGEGEGEGGEGGIGGGAGEVAAGMVRLMRCSRSTSVACHAQPHSSTAEQQHSRTAAQPHSRTAAQQHSRTAAQPHSSTAAQPGIRRMELASLVSHAHAHAMTQKMDRCHSSTRLFPPPTGLPPPSPPTSP
ncbi:unnamed protein product [Closterium sp. NIES-54]